MIDLITLKAPHIFSYYLHVFTTAVLTITFRFSSFILLFKCVHLIVLNSQLKPNLCNFRGLIWHSLRDRTWSQGARLSIAADASRFGSAVVLGKKKQSENYDKQQQQQRQAHHFIDQHHNQQKPAIFSHHLINWVNGILKLVILSSSRQFHFSNGLRAVFLPLVSPD